MTWKDEIRKNVKFRDTAYTEEGYEDRNKIYRRKKVHKAEKEILEKLMKEVDKIPDGVLQFLYVQSYKIADGVIKSREDIEKLLKIKLRRLLFDNALREDEQSAFENRPELFQNLMRNELFASVLGNMKYDVEYTNLNTIKYEGDEEDVDSDE